MGQHRDVNTTRRTILLTGITATLVPGTLVARAQQQAEVRRLGVLGGIGVTDALTQKNDTALVQGLGTLGWKEGVNLHIDWRRTGGDLTLYDHYPAELVALHPDVILAPSTPAVEALRRQPARSRSCSPTLPIRSAKASSRA